MTRAWVDVPRPERVSVRKGRHGAVAVGYLPSPAGYVPLAAAGADERRARRALVGALAALASDHELARTLGLRTVALPEGVEHGEASKLGQLVRHAASGDAGARTKLRRLRSKAKTGDERAGKMWALACSQNGRGRVTRAAHYAPSVAASMGAEARPYEPPPPVAPPVVFAPPPPPPLPPPRPQANIMFGFFPPTVGLAVPGVVNFRDDAGTSALLASARGPSFARGVFAWGR